MARRAGFSETRQYPVEPGKPPNHYLGKATIEISMYAPPYISTADMLKFLDETYDAARARLTRGWPNYDE